MPFALQPPTRKIGRTRDGSGRQSSTSVRENAGTSNWPVGPRGSRRPAATHPGALETPRGGGVSR